MRTTNALERMRGLLGRKPLSRGQGLLISPCSSIHTFGMNYPLDLIFLDKRWKINKLFYNLKPFRIVCSPGSFAVIEALGGTLESFNLEKGTILVWENC